MTWDDVLVHERQQPYMQDLTDFVASERQSHDIFPAHDDVFAALSLCPFEDVRVVIVGQDPYHTPGCAHGLCFSVPDGVRMPPSLTNICTELRNDVGGELQSGDLSFWARQGVLLLNSVLTVRSGQAASHAHKGWERYTDAIIRAVGDHHDHVVFMLWGKYAQEKGRMIDPDAHTVLTAPHPSPLSAHRGFFGCRHFLRANAALQQHGQSPVVWC